MGGRKTVEISEGMVVLNHKTPWQYIFIYSTLDRGGELVH